MGPAPAGNRFSGSGSDRRLQASDPVGRARSMAARADRLRSLHAARPDSGTGRAGDQDPSAGGVGLRPRRGVELQKKTLLPEEQIRPDVARKRARWKTYQSRIDPTRLVFIDETWVKTSMAPLRGWGARGRRLKAYAPHGHWKTLTFIAALRHDRVDAPWVIDGPINGELFLLYVETILAPTLAKGEVVIMDNLGSHKNRAARNALRASGAHLFFLPPYSPDLNPIEQVFAKLKHMMRKAQARDIEATWRKVGELLDLFAPRRVRQLSRQLRIWFHLKESCSNCLIFRFSKFRGTNALQKFLVTGHATVTVCETGNRRKTMQGIDRRRMLRDVLFGAAAVTVGITLMADAGEATPLARSGLVASR